MSSDHPNNQLNNNPDDGDDERSGRGGLPSEPTTEPAAEASEPEVEPTEDANSDTATPDTLIDELADGADDGVGALGETTSPRAEPVGSAALVAVEALTDSPASRASGSEDSDKLTPRRLGAGFWFAAAWMVLVCAAAALTNVLPLREPDQLSLDPDLGLPPYPPSPQFWFGTDDSGFDLFSRCIHGARISLTVGFTSIALGLAIGGTLGIVAGYFRGWLDRIISFLFLMLLSFPAIVLAVLITSLVERTLMTISITIGVVSIAPIGRLARATTIQYADRDFVVAARTLGARHGRVIVRELLPNVIIPMGALALLGVSVAIVAEGALAFLGLSVQKELSWGKLIQAGAGSDSLTGSPWVAFAPILMLFLTVVSLNFAGDRIRKYFDVKETLL